MNLANLANAIDWPIVSRSLDAQPVLDPIRC